MQYITLGKTGITVPRNGFGALPIQRVSEDTAISILKKAYDNGIRFFDTARFYTDSEKKVGLALSPVRENIIIATKTMCETAQAFNDQLNTSLTLLKTSYIDIYQFHNPSYVPRPGDELYDAMLKAKSEGKIRHIGITNHRLDLAIEAANSGLYDTIQYPISYLASSQELDFVRLCKEREVGVIAMKALSGGLITNSKAAYAFFTQFDHVVPIWGIQRESELDEFLSYNDAPPALDDSLRTVINRDIEELSGDFCRGCGYCLPCPANINIPTSARMSLLIRRAPSQSLITPEAQEKMNRIYDCINCGHCKKHCPYGLDTPKLLRENLEDYKTFL